MELTELQKKGLEIAVKRYKSGEKYTVIAGYAGSGKSTLVRYIIAALQVPATSVAYATPTGKAAEVLRKKGNQNAITLHKLLYKSSLQKDGTYRRFPVKELPYQVVVVDECSMVPQSMVDTLLKHRVYVLFLGDPFQIPPILKSDENTLLQAPHIFLSEIMRQAQESEIIQLTMAIREGKPFGTFKGKEAQIYNHNELSEGMLTWADQIICATNKTRNMINNKMRDLQGFSGSPKEGEKLICLHNYWDIVNPLGEALVNGTTGFVTNIEKGTVSIPHIRDVKSRDLDVYNFDLETDDADGIFTDLAMDRNMLETDKYSLTSREEYRLTTTSPYKDTLQLPMQFSYGYAITGHRAQGSQWDKVLVIEENFPFNAEEHARWLYTCCTRPAQKLVLIRK
jgi:exodeoxyribonuclease V